MVAKSRRRRHRPPGAAAGTEARTEARADGRTEARAEAAADARGATAGTDTYAFVRAPRLLGGLVPSAVGYHVEDQPQGGLHRGLPSPYLTLIFSLHEPVVAGETPEQARGPEAYSADIVLGGLHQRPAFVRRPRHEAGIQLAVHPLAARTLTGMPAAELYTLTEDAADVLGGHAALVRERLCELGGWHERFTVLTDYLRARTEDHERRTGVRPEVAEAWRWMAWHRGGGSMDGLAAHVALSPRQLSTLFRRELGIGPKQASRLMRFEHARQRIARTLQRGAPLDLADVAAHCGFYDHSHLVRDFHQYTGLSPTAWIAEEHRNIQAGGHHVDEQWDP
ncbi:AraC family transcriptional regulator [Streptomyces armeniacus]|uniref:AraC family transcriptional regulator n=1 Tax=Streptomyces armeniacus TaxID=83291 RepID=A0A345XYP6_9ACTN|nr:helix-turn-helix domain-containing protein [Streptomyces armeniacus]AXK36762.1 AraC family transcriptional regulator [Streptomyces armeniacus]